MADDATKNQDDVKIDEETQEKADEIKENEEVKETEEKEEVSSDLSSEAQAKEETEQVETAEEEKEEETEKKEEVKEDIKEEELEKEANEEEKKEEKEEESEQEGSEKEEVNEEEAEEKAEEEKKEEPEEKPEEEEVKEEIEEEEEKEDIFSKALAKEEEKSPGKTKGKQAKGTGRNWYVIHTYSGYEDAVEKSLRQRIESFNMQDYIFDVIVPKESAISIKKGSHITEKIRMFPGYVLVDMIVTDDSWYVVRNTPNVTGFVGSGTIPVPVLPEEFDRIKKHVSAEEPTFKVKFQIGENVSIVDGPFKDCEGLIDDIDEKKGRAKILVNVFGRETPVELEFTQIKKKD
jgi:transcriptional antiterminator NusG